MGKIVSISIAGLGGRGGEAYGPYLNAQPDKWQIASILEPNPVRRKKYGDLFHVKEENRFADEDEFFEKKRSDVLIISTMDHLHVRQALKAIPLGYDILLEKPISESKEELSALEEAHLAHPSIIMVCHVLRYTAMVRKIKEWLDEEKIGRLITIDHTENICYWHMAHSFVRGNWHSRKDSAPMIMAKCCHDLDLLQFFIGSRCEKLSSMGDLRYFKKENQPQGATHRCLDCPYGNSCPYSAKLIYERLWAEGGKGPDVWPIAAITDVVPQTEEAILDALRNGPYGVCAFDCDNDMPDNQTTAMTFENGVTATLKMEAFTALGGRDIRLLGSRGEIDLHEEQGRGWLERWEFGKNDPVEHIPMADFAYADSGHGGGDHAIIDALYDAVTGGKQSPETALEKSLESHYMAIAAEDSRLAGGEVKLLRDYR